MYNKPSLSASKNTDPHPILSNDVPVSVATLVKVPSPLFFNNTFPWIDETWLNGVFVIYISNQPSLLKSPNVVDIALTSTPALLESETSWKTPSPKFLYNLLMFSSLSFETYMSCKPSLS